jgi:hypothetical protein
LFELVTKYALLQSFIEASVASDFLFGHVQLALEKTDAHGNAPDSCTSITDAFNKHIGGSQMASQVMPNEIGRHAHVAPHMSTPAHKDRFVAAFVSMFYTEISSCYCLFVRSVNLHA